MAVPYLVYLSGDFYLLDASTPDLTLTIEQIAPWIEDNGMVVPVAITVLAPSGSIPLATYMLVQEPADGCVIRTTITRDSTGEVLYSVVQDLAAVAEGATIDLRNVVDTGASADLRGEFYYLNGTPFVGTLRVELTADWLRKTFPGGLIATLPSTIDYALAEPTAKDITDATQADPCVVTSVAHGFEDGDIVEIAGCLGMTELNGHRFMVNDKTADDFELWTVTDAVAITGATKANPCVVTAPGHTCAAGEVIRIDGVLGMTELNGHEFTVANPVGNTFELSGVSSVGYTTYASGGVVRQLVDSTAYGAYPSYAISGATKANPCVITAVGHTFVAGQSVDIADVVGMTELNGNKYEVGTVAGDTFELAGVDSSGYGAYVSGGTARLTTDGTVGWANHIGRTHLYVPGVYNLTLLDAAGTVVWSRDGVSLDEDTNGSLVCTITDQIVALNQS